ncbi:MAG: hypothetical protein AB7G13_23720 [Lautropia sp.]
MSLFRRSNEVVFDPGRGHRQRRVPDWLVWLGVGILIGVLGLFWAQERFGPQRLTVHEARALIADRDRIKAERLAAEAEAADASRQLQARLDESTLALARVKEDLGRRTASAAAAEDSVANLKRELDLFEAVMPPDPRGNPIGVRAARLERNPAGIAYHVLLSRDGNLPRPFGGIMQFSVVGNQASGARDTVTVGPFAVNVAGFEHVRGVAKLPKGFEPRQATIQILDKAEGQQLGMRIINVDSAR